MEQNFRIILGFLTIMPLICLIYALASDFSPPSSIVFYAYPTVFIVWVFSLLVLYLVDLYKNKVERKIMWVALFLAGSIVTMPVYWYLYIWPRKEKKHNHRRVKHIFDYWRMGRD